MIGESKEQDNYLYVLLATKKKRKSTCKEKVTSKHKRNCRGISVKGEKLNGMDLQYVQKLKKQNRMLKEENKLYQEYYKVFQDKYQQKDHENAKLKEELLYFKKQITAAQEKPELTTCYSESKIKSPRLYTFQNKK